MTKVLITGGAGFIGSNFVRYLLEQHSDYQIVVLDKLTYAGNLLNLKELLDDPRLTIAHLDLCDPDVAEAVSGCEFVVHLAAESHVDRSIHDAAVFVRTNVEGTLNLVECCRRASVKRYVQVSTDEVYGSLGPRGKFTESSPIDPSSPYSASKAAADLLVQSYFRTHRFPAMVTRCSNNYGPFQFPEKFIPLMISQALAHQYLPVYGDGRNVRNWIHVNDHCVALDLILHRGREGQVYNIGGSSECANLALALRILELTDRPKSLIKFVTDRLGHDRRYAINYGKLNKELGWRPAIEFELGLSQTIEWYQNNTEWLETTKNGEYREYFRKHYLQTAAAHA
jgi:dTDP-glucose 4,6-dehydratase